MKRRDLIRHLERHGCEFYREGGNHTVYVNPVNNRVSAIPRHREINEFLARKICRDMGVPAPKYVRIVTPLIPALMAT
jgi:mRNA interferase HicA